MSLDSAILHGKEHRRKYRRSKAVCRSCRNHGGFPHCEGSRLRYKRISDIEYTEGLKEINECHQ